MANLPESKIRSAESYKEAVRYLRTVANGFGASDDYDLRSYHKISDIPVKQRRRIRKYWKVAREGISQGASTMRFRNKTRLKATQTYSRLKYPKDFKVAYVVKRPSEEIVYKQVKGKPVVKNLVNRSTGIGHRDAFFVPDDLIAEENPLPYLKTFMAENMDEKETAVVINGSNFILMKPKNGKAMARYIKFLMNKYDDYEEWLDGIHITTGPTASKINRFVDNRSNHYIAFKDIRDALVRRNRKLEKAITRAKKKPTKRNKDLIKYHMRKKIELLKQMKAVNKKYGY